MSFTEKIDVLDLLINILKEHEEKLDKLVERLENTVAYLLAGDDASRHQLIAYLHAEGEQRDLKEYLNEKGR